MQNYMFSTFCFVDTVFTMLFSTVLIIKLTEGFTSTLVHFGLYFFWMIFEFVNEEQSHRDIMKNVIISF